MMMLEIALNLPRDLSDEERIAVALVELAELFALKNIGVDLTSCGI